MIPRDLTNVNATGARQIPRTILAARFVRASSETARARDLVRQIAALTGDTDTNPLLDEASRYLVRCAIREERIAAEFEAASPSSDAIAQAMIDDAYRTFEAADGSIGQVAHEGVVPVQRPRLLVPKRPWRRRRYER